MKNEWLLNIQKDPESGDHFLELPDELLAELDWQVGDKVRWTQRNQSSWVLTNRAARTRKAAKAGKQEGTVVKK
jgi:hypothetical protein